MNDQSTKVGIMMRNGLQSNFIWPIRIAIITWKQYSLFDYVS